jgi:hypothetical protein
MNQIQFKKVKKYIRKWIDLFGLQGYQVSVMFGEVDNEKAAASVSFDVTERVAIVVIDKSVEGELSDRVLEKIAVHEMLELLLGGMRNLIESLYNSDVADQEIHIVIRTLERLLVK